MAAVAAAATAAILLCLLAAGPRGLGVGRGRAGVVGGVIWICASLYAPSTINICFWSHYCSQRMAQVPSWPGNLIYPTCCVSSTINLFGWPHCLMDIKKVYGKSNMTMGEITLLWDYEDIHCGTGHIGFLYPSHATGYNGTGTTRCWFWVTVQKSTLF